MATGALTTTGTPIKPTGSTTTLSTPSKEFEEEKFMKDLIHLRDSQEAIQGLSGWCIRNRKNNEYKIARCWLKCIKKVKVDQKLTLFHLLNDVVQHSKKRNYDELLEKFQAQIREAMPHLKDTKITEKIHRCLNIWAERQVFEDKFVQELIATIDPSQNRPEQDILDNFQPQQLCTQIKIMKALEDDTDYKLRTVKESEVNLMDMDETILRQNLKDRQHGNDYINEVDDGRKRLEQYIKAIDRELTKRRQVIEMLTHAGKYYDSLLGEANIVATAYTNFGKRVKNLNRKLEDRMEETEQAKTNRSKRHLSENSSLGEGQASGFLEDISPVPSPDYDAPSPEADELELQLPDDTIPIGSNMGGSIQSSGTPTPTTSPLQSPYTHQPNMVELGANGTITSGGGDLNSRLDCMRSSMTRLEDLPSYTSSTGLEHQLKQSSTSKMQSMSDASTSAALSVTPTTLSESRQETSQNSSGFSISEYLTKLAKGGDTSSPGYQQEPAFHAGHYNRENLASAASNYSHPPPPPTDSHHPGLPFNMAPQGTDTNWWLRQQPPLPPNSAPNHNQHIEPPPITAWSRDGDPPPATSWPAPMPDVWSSTSSEQRNNSWQHQSAALDPVPEWQLPLEEDEPPDNESALYSNKGTSETYTENLALARLQLKQSSGTFSAESNGRERKNSASSAANNLISLTRGSPSSNDTDENRGQPSSLSMSHNSSSNAINKIAQPPPLTTPHQPTHLVHDDMEMCSDEDEETTKDSQFDHFAYNELEQGIRTAGGNVHALHLQRTVPPLMSEEEFNKFKYSMGSQNHMGPPMMDNPPPTAGHNQNSLMPTAGPFSNPPPSLSVDQNHSHFAPVPPTPPRRVNPYLTSAPRELSQDEKEEEKRTHSLQDRLRNLAGVPIDKNEGNVQSAHPNVPHPSYPAPNGQEKCTMGNNFNRGGSVSRGSAHRDGPGVNYNEFRGGHIGGPPFGGDSRGMMRPQVSGSWRGGPRNGLPMRGMRGGGRGRPGPRW